MIGIVLLAGVLNVVTIGEFIEAIEARGHAAVQAEGMDRSFPLTEGAAAEIGRELGVPLTSMFPHRIVDRGKVQFLVWVLTPAEQEAKRKKGHGLKKGHHKSPKDPGMEELGP